MTDGAKYLLDRAAAHDDGLTGLLTDLGTPIHATRYGVIHRSIRDLAWTRETPFTDADADTASRQIRSTDPEMSR